MSNQVKFFQSSQTGAPQLTGQAGSLISVLNACLLNGFNLRAVTSITRDSDVATVTVDAGHGYRDHDTVEISGAVQAEYNGAHRIRNCTTNTFQYTVDDEPATPATGTIAAKISPLGWDSPLTGVSKAAYRSRNLTSNRMFLRIDETSIAGTAPPGYLTTSAAVTMAEKMTDIDTATGTALAYWRKSTTADATVKDWFIVGDEKRFWLCVQCFGVGANTLYSNYFFGDILSFKPGDTYSTLLIGYSQLGGNYAYNYFSADQYFTFGNTSSVGMFFTRSYSQVGSAVNANFVSLQVGNYSSFGNGSLPFPNPADNGIYVVPVLVAERSPDALRGSVPGFFQPLHLISLANNLATVYGGVPISGTTRRLITCRGCSNQESRLAIDITGPWE